MKICSVWRGHRSKELERIGDGQSDGLRCHAVSIGDIPCIEIRPNSAAISKLSVNKITDNLSVEF